MIKKLFVVMFLLLLQAVSAMAQERYVIAYAGFAGFQSPLRPRTWVSEQVHPGISS
jgi:hypothetical protein